MSSSNLIRLGGLAAIAGGLLYTLQTFSGEFWGGFIVALGLGALAAIAALHVLQRERYGLPGALSSLAVFVGVALFLVGSWIGQFYPMAYTNFAGALVVTGGLLGLGVVTMTARVLPWWCGVALIAGSPPFGLLGPVVAVAWVVVGYAVFRAAGRQTERPSRVR
jgi:hypothetical protein